MVERAELSWSRRAYPTPEPGTLTGDPDPLEKLASTSQPCFGKMTRRAAGVTVLSSAAVAVGSTTPTQSGAGSFGNRFAKRVVGGWSKSTEELRRRLERQGGKMLISPVLSFPLRQAVVDAAVQSADRARLTRAVPSRS